MTGCPSGCPPERYLHLSSEDIQSSMGKVSVSLILPVPLPFLLANLPALPLVLPVLLLVLLLVLLFVPLVFLPARSCWSCWSSLPVCWSPAKAPSGVFLPVPKAPRGVLCSHQFYQTACLRGLCHAGFSDLLLGPQRDLCHASSSGVVQKKAGKQAQVKLLDLCMVRDEKEQNSCSSPASCYIDLSCHSPKISS